MYHFPLSLQYIYECIDEGGKNVNVKEWRLPGLLYADNLVLCGESKEDLKVMVGCFVEVCRRIGLKFNAGK